MPKIPGWLRGLWLWTPPLHTNSKAKQSKAAAFSSCPDNQKFPVPQLVLVLLAALAKTTENSIRTPRPTLFHIPPSGTFTFTCNCNCNSRLGNPGTASTHASTYNFNLRSTPLPAASLTSGFHANNPHIPSAFHTYLASLSSGHFCSHFGRRPLCRHQHLHQPSTCFVLYLSCRQSIPPSPPH